jgi:putative serine/threonine protein kinase
VDADRNIMQREAKLLEKANSVLVGPILYAVSDNFLLMQLVEGCPILDWLGKKLGITIVKKVLIDILEQCWRLDQIGMDHGELSHAPKHIVINRNREAFILDFESASVERKPANVTSTCHFLFASGLVRRDTPGRKLDIDQSKLIEVLKRYKRAKTRENFEEILRVCCLQTM